MEVVARHGASCQRAESPARRRAPGEETALLPAPTKTAIDSAAHFFIAVEANLSDILSSFLLDWSLWTLWRGRLLADSVAKVVLPEGVKNSEGRRRGFRLGI